MSKQHLPYCACPLCKPDEDTPRWLWLVQVLLAAASTLVMTGLGLWVYNAIAHVVGHP